MLPEAAGQGQHFHGRGHSFSLYGPTLSRYFFPSSQTKKNSRKKTHASVTVTVVRDRKIRTALKTNQIAGFVTVPAWKKKNICYLPAGRSVLGKTEPSVLSTALGLRPRAVSKPRSQFFPIRTDQGRQTTCYFFLW